MTSLGFIFGDDYPTLGNSLLVCESATGVLRRLKVSGRNFDQVTGVHEIVTDCKLGLTESPEGIIYYSNETEIRQIVAQ